MELTTFSFDFPSMLMEEKKTFKIISLKNIKVKNLTLRNHLLQRFGNELSGSS